MKKCFSNVIIIGGGIAGLFAALKIANTGKTVLLVTKSHLGESNTRYAQGGIVAVMDNNKPDSIELHVNDTICAGAGLSCKDVAKFVSQTSQNAINDLIDYGVPFDKDNNGNLSFTVEAAHSVRRILHSGGDATGKMIEQTLCARIKENSLITVWEKSSAIELLLDKSNNCSGAIIFKEENNENIAVFSDATVIASGGIGQLYSNTTNPTVATGDGIALAYRASAVLNDMEFVQFHPTAFYSENIDTRFLISESVRGEGAKLKNNKNELFAQNYHDQGELAPRDIVSRMIFFEMQKTNADSVKLDTSLIDSNKFNNRFPTIVKHCINNNIDPYNDGIPVSPAAHYFMGGIKTDLEGKTNVKNLYTIGEAACTSLHGANRLASNSLLECIVFADSLANYISNKPIFNISNDKNIENLLELYSSKNIPVNYEKTDYLTKKLKETMWKNAGIIRNKDGLTNALKDIYSISNDFGIKSGYATIKEYELRNMLIVAEIIVKSALARKESRGAHYREDFPNAFNKAYHSCTRKGESLIDYVLPCTGFNS